MKSPRREQNFEKRFFHQVFDNSRLRKTANKMYKKFNGNAFTVLLTIFNAF
jgi:hypothetical protein